MISMAVVAHNLAKERHTPERYKHLALTVKLLGLANFKASNEEEALTLSAGWLHEILSTNITRKEVRKIFENYPQEDDLMTRINSISMVKPNFNSLQKMYDHYHLYRDFDHLFEIVIASEIAEIMDNNLQYYPCFKLGVYSPDGEAWRESWWDLADFLFLAKGGRFYLYNSP
jgi:hypothetical protein